MKKFLKHEGNTYEGIFMPLPGKKNYGHFLLDGILLRAKKSDGSEGSEVVFGLGRAEEIFVKNDEDDKFFGFSNLNQDSKMKQQAKAKEERAAKPIRLNKREDIQAMSKDAEEIVIALKKHATDGVVFLKEVKDVNPNKLYGHLINLEKAKIIKRLSKDKKRGTKIKILK